MKILNQAVWLKFSWIEKQVCRVEITALGGVDQRLKLGDMHLNHTNHVTGGGGCSQLMFGTNVPQAGVKRKRVNSGSDRAQKPRIQREQNILTGSAYSGVKYSLK